MDLEERKKALRQEIKAAAAALDEGYTKEADLEIFSHVAGLPEYEQAGFGGRKIRYIGAGGKCAGHTAGGN